MNSPTTRVLAVLELLQSHDALSGQALAQRLEVDGRTLRRYISKLQELGIPVVSERGRYGAYRLTPGSKLPPMMFTDTEAVALSVGLLFAKQLGLAATGSGAQSAQAKLERVMPKGLGAKLRAVGETVQLDLSQAGAAIPSEALLEMSAAAHGRHRVRLQYGSASDEMTEREFDCYGLAWRALALQRQHGLTASIAKVHVATYRPAHALRLGLRADQHIPTMDAMKDPMPPILTYNASPSAPTLTLPALACDSHVHVFGPAVRFPFAENRNFTPVDAPKETLFALHQKLGIGRCVIVQSITHGFDNRVVEDAIAAGEGRYLGVALAPANVADAELQRLAAAGFRAVRFNFMTHLAGSSNMDEVLDLTPRLKAVGMHLQVHFESGLIHRLGPALSRSAVPVVIDHMGRVDAALGTDQPDFVALHALLKNPLFHVKVSGIDRIDPHPEGAQPYANGVALARLLLQSYPDRCVWGTDWPHPNHTYVPDDGVLVDALARIAPTPALLDKLLVQNPHSLYGFAG